MKEVKKCVDMNLQTMKEEGQRERKIITAYKREEEIKQTKKSEAKEKKAKQSKAKQNNVNIILW